MYLVSILILKCEIYGNIRILHLHSWISMVDIWLGIWFGATIQMSKCQHEPFVPQFQNEHTNCIHSIAYWQNSTLNDGKSLQYCFIKIAIDQIQYVIFEMFQQKRDFEYRHL